MLTSMGRKVSMERRDARPRANTDTHFLKQDFLSRGQVRDDINVS